MGTYSLLRSHVVSSCFHTPIPQQKMDTNRDGASDASCSYMLVLKGLWRMSKGPQITMRRQENQWLVLFLMFLMWASVSGFTSLTSFHYLHNSCSRLPRGGFWLGRRWCAGTDTAKWWTPKTLVSYQWGWCGSPNASNRPNQTQSYPNTCWSIFWSNGRLSMQILRCPGLSMR